MLLTEIYNKIRYNNKADRIGPDLPFTHWRLYFESTMKKICKSKFLLFDNEAQFRAGAYAVGCSKIKIGKRVVIRPHTMLFGETIEAMDVSITIEDDVMLGSGVHIYVNNHRFDRTDTPIINQGYYPSKEVILRKGCWIGANTIILPGVQIGENAVIGAGSIVTKSIPSFSLAVGNPAKVIKKVQ
jgi:acetyltransferase-like isoleucine patch superfamily enzyme